MATDCTASDLLVIHLKKCFWPAREWHDGISMKLASWHAKLLHEARKQYPGHTPDRLAWWLSQQSAEALLALVKVPDSRPVKHMSTLGKSLVKYLPKEGDSIACHKP